MGYGIGRWHTWRQPREDQLPTIFRGQCAARDG